MNDKQASLEWLDRQPLSTRAFNVLRNMIDARGSVLDANGDFAISLAELARAPHCGKVTLQEIRDVVAAERQPKLADGAHYWIKTWQGVVLARYDMCSLRFLESMDCFTARTRPALTWHAQSEVEVLARIVPPADDPHPPTAA